MKRLILLTAVAALCITMTGCGALVMAGPGGALLYADAKGPAAALAYYGATATGSTKVGTASYNNILGILATGDASLDAAMRAGGITKLHHCDVQITNILGIIATYKLIAYGE